MSDNGRWQDMRGEFDEIPIKNIQLLMENRELSALELVDYYLNRIEMIDKKGPVLNSVLEINPDVREIVGIKPTVGLVSRNGIIPISHSQDTAGPIARTVADVALILYIIAENSIVKDKYFPGQIIVKA